MNFEIRKISKMNFFVLELGKNYLLPRLKLNLGCIFRLNPIPRADDRIHSNGRLRRSLVNCSVSSIRLFASFAGGLLNCWEPVDCDLVG